MMRSLALVPVAFAAEANPIRRVVTLLQNLQKEIEAEGEKEEKLMEKHQCFCSQNNDGMTQTVERAKTKIVQLTSAVQEFSSAKQKTDSEVVQAKADRAEAEDTVKKQTAQRKKEKAAYDEAVGDQRSSIEAVSQAIVVLEKGAASLVQMESNGLARLRRVALTAKLSAYDKQALTSFLGMETNNPYGDYQSSSGEITGILKQMKDQMDVDLNGAIKEEEGRVASFKALMKSQKDIIAASTKAIERKTVRSGELAVSAAESKAELKNTKAKLTETERFLANLSIACDNKDKEWAERQKTRAEEIAAVADAIKFLNDDDALEVFKKTLPSPGSSFLQLPATKQKLQKALALVNTAAKHNPRMSMLAYMMKQGKVSFDKVLKMIDDMVVLLGREQDTDDQHRSKCMESLDENEDELKELAHKLEGHNSKSEELSGAIESLKAEVNTLQGEIAETNKAVADSTAQRKADNAEFVQTQTETNAAIQLIEKAKNRMNKFYNPSLYKEAKPRELSDEDRVYQNLGGELEAEVPETIAGTTQTVNFMQIRAHQPTPPKTFGAYKKNQKSGGITALMDMLLADLRKSQTEAASDEKHDAKEYEELMADSKKQLKADQTAVTQASEALAEREARLSTERDNLSGTSTEISNAKDLEAKLHGDCDWLLKNFDVRKAQRSDETEALKQAKATLKGADFS